MKRLFDPYTVSRAFRDPVTRAAFIVDLIPVYAVIVLGWGAAPLVFLYWLENLVIGGVTIARMVVAGLAKGLFGIAQIIFFVGFFTVHYGMFCFGHGFGLMALLANEGLQTAGASAHSGIGGVVSHALASGSQMTFFLGIIIAFNIFLFVWDYIGKGEYLEVEPAREMMAPYGRIMLLHFALFAGMFALMSLGEPMLGVVALIVLRMIWGVFLSIRRRIRLDQKLTDRHKS